MSCTIILVRGLPGAGKTSLTERMDAVTASADDFPGLYTENEDGSVAFHGGDKMDDGQRRIAHAHSWCQDQAYRAVQNDQHVVVHNTFTQRWEMQPYMDIAEGTGDRLVVVDLFDGGLSDSELAKRNSHGVPEEAIARMRERYEHDWSVGNPTPPWERENEQ